MFHLLKKYKHGFILGVYLIFYSLAFQYLETRNVRGFHIINTSFDDLIPFCEYFIVPYLLWFPYIGISVCYFIFINKNKEEYYQLAKNLIMGMTLFLLVSFLYPNIHLLRPKEFIHDTIFTKAVAALYQADTPTNILPSIHVFNSMAVYQAIKTCRSLKKHKWIERSTGILTFLIILSTLFLKQHTIIDVFLGMTLAYFGAWIFYPEKSASAVYSGNNLDYRTPESNHSY